VSKYKEPLPIGLYLYRFDHSMAALGYRDVGLNADWANSAWLLAGAMDGSGQLVLFENEDNDTYELLYECSKYGVFEIQLGMTGEQALKLARDVEAIAKIWAEAHEKGSDK